MKNLALSLLGLFLFQVSCYARDEKEMFVQLLNDDSADISIIASYPETVRNAVFEACTQPQGIVNIANIQKGSQAEFRSALSPYSKEEQQKIWNLTRYSGLIDKLVGAGQLSAPELESILKDYPEEVREAATDYTLHHFELLKTISGLDTRFALSFNDAIKAYSSVTQASFRELLNTPELISLLNNNLRVAVNLGVIYQKNPGYVKQQFDILNLELAQQKARDLEEWKQKLQDDPDAETELQQSAKEYATENGYSESDYYETDPVIINRYVFVPYPYWCGYPSWYEYEWWYPYPYWYHWGFSYWHGTIVWHSPPSWFFVHWHFRHYPHFHRYPRITNVYFNYYHGHHRQEVKSSETVNKWYEQNSRVLPEDFTTNEKNRVEVIKDFGRFEGDYQKENSTEHGNLNRSDFLNKNQSNYPALKQTLPAQSKPADNKYLNEKESPKLPVNERPAYKPIPEKPVVKPQEPRQQQPYQPRPDVQPVPKHQPGQNVQPKQNIQPVPKPQPKQNIQPRPNTQPPMQYQPKPNVQPKPQVQPVPRQNNPVPKNQLPVKK